MTGQSIRHVTLTRPATGRLGLIFAADTPYVIDSINEEQVEFRVAVCLFIGGYVRSLPDIAASPRLTGSNVTTRERGR